MVHETRGLVASRVARGAGLAAIALLNTYFLLQPFPIAAKVLAELVLALSVVSPGTGLLVLAGLAPLSSAIGGLSGGGGAFGTQMLEQMALAIGAGALVRRKVPETRTRIGSPAFLLAIVAVASAAALLPATAVSLPQNVADGSVFSQLTVRPVQYSPQWGSLFSALLVAECALLGWAVERTVRSEPRLAERLVLIGLIGHAGAAVMTFQAVLGGALRTGHVLEALPQLLKILRISLQTDVHAAASALLLAGVAGLGLLHGSLVRSFGLGLLAVVVATGLWMTGSRVAIVLGVVAAVAAIGAVRRPSIRAGSWRVVAAAAAVLVIASGIWLTTVYPSTRFHTLEASTSPRVAIFKAGMQMFATAPVFGIGIARFYATSADFVGPDLAKVAGTPRENAHNNFLQVLAELGLVGFGAMLWWLASVVLSAWRVHRSHPDPLRGALLVAIVACIGTWMTGHPLLVPEFAVVFWLYLGILAAMTPAPVTSRLRPVMWLVVAGVLVSAPFRARAHLNVVDLEHRGVGVSALWQHDDEQRYREAGAAFGLYLPATGRPVEVPLRRAPGAPDPLLVDVRIGSRPLQKISAAGDAWQTVLIVVPVGPRRFELVEFTVQPPAGTVPPPVLLRVGRDAAR